MPASAPRAGQLPRYLRRVRLDATPLLVSDPLGTPTDTGVPTDLPADDPVLAFRYRSAEPIAWEGMAVHPLYSEQLSTPAAALTVTLLSATPPAGLTGVGIGLSMVDGYIDIDGRRLAGVDIWRDALERGITFDLTANSPGTLFVLTPVWADTAGESQSWSGNYGIVVERTDNGRTVLWCSMGEGPPHFADLVVEVRSTPLDPRPQLSTPGTGVVPSVSVPAAWDGFGSGRIPRLPAVDTTAVTAVPGQYGAGRAAGSGRPAADSGEPEGYPCSLADLVLHPPYTDDADILVEPLDGADEFFDYSSLFDEPVPGSLPPLTFSGPATLLTGPDQWYERTVEAGAGADPAAAHGWADSPDQTGLVPVISGEDLPDYGPEPVREPRTGGESTVFPLPAAYFTAPRAVHRIPADESTATDEPAAADTIADGSLAPFPAVDSSAATGSPDRLYDLGSAWCAAGDDEQAARWWAEAADAGHLGAAYDLGALYYRHDEFDAAQRWWQVAAGRRHIRAMASLADMLEQLGAVPEARMWRAQAVAEEVIANAAQTTDSFAVPTARR